jgi:hypothetical protein
MTIDTTDPAAVRAEAKRRQQLRDQGATTFDEEMREVYLMSARGLETPVVTKVIGPIETPRARDSLDRRHARHDRRGAADEEEQQAPLHASLQSAGLSRLPRCDRQRLPPAARRPRAPARPIATTTSRDVLRRRKGEQADLVGLLQGLADALENAGVVSNDRWFRAFDGSRMIAGDPRPRVELEIRPL